ncbi:hypothetical protein [Neobacillus mesonae]|uniref:LysM domain-containing protein n=1 Tax=Neobacillus mesonae TaxID=1193713 RepID=A0A3T0I1W6_9BACI|nr:hypothetical protein [Neobacillus mesonae]AZU63346.1 hypothetical protein CHR53_19920 [Neobacillus mesonae]MED4204427.1 hypothetical protein [Neobacillus mesonae]
MKNFVGVLIAVLVIYVIYFDLTVGTLPSLANQHVEKSVNQHGEINEAIQNPKMALPYFDAKVEPGQTVISVVEHQLGKSLPVSISDLINDFKKLNEGQSPEKIKIGVTYHFPDYSN